MAGGIPERSSVRSSRESSPGARFWFVRQLVTRPLISGTVFGLIVYVAMQIMLVAANLFRLPTPRELGVALLAYVVFFRCA